MFYFTFADPYIIFAAIVLLFAWSAHVLFAYPDWVRRHEKTILLIVAILLIWSQLARYGFSILRDGFDATDYFPFYICRISSLVLLYYILTKDRRVEAFLFYWGATGLAGVIYPNGAIANVANLTETFYIDHVLLGLTPFYLVMYRGFRPDKENLVRITGVMLVTLLVFIPINEWLGTDYFYTKDQSIFGILFPFLPDRVFGLDIALSSILFAFAHTAAAYGFFYLYYKWFSKPENKRVIA
jgi:hypothetical integral membrane protein (TIGR02206 family)